jgi:hypothetical protein
MTLRKATLSTTVSGILVLAVLILSGSQCSEVSDRAVNPQGSEFGTGDDASRGAAACVAACNDLGRDLRREERNLHHDNVRACDGNSECLDEEEARHEARMEEIASIVQACKAPCHEQGRGSGGQ